MWELHYDYYYYYLFFLGNGVGVSDRPAGGAVSKRERAERLA